MKKNKLLCTFTRIKHLENTLCDIKERYVVSNNKVIVLENMDNTDELYCIYNVECCKDGFLPRTILIHRKRESNTLYTINSLNRKIWLLNDGKRDNNYRIPWVDYKNRFFLIREDELLEIPTQLLKIEKF